MRTEVKICGFTRRADVEAAISLDFAYAGAVLYAGSTRGVAVARLPELFGGLKGKIVRVGVFVDAPVFEVEAALDTGCLDVVQLHGRESAAYAEALGRRVAVWKAVTLADEADVAAATAFPAARLVADAPGGGSGKRCDWRLASQLARRRPVMLAGGLHPGNAAAALAQVKPAGLDLAGGVEITYGIKSIERMLQLKEVLS